MGATAHRPTGHTSSRGSRHGRHRRRSRHGFLSSAPPYALALIAVLMIALGGVMVWEGVEYFTHAFSRDSGQPNPNPASQAATAPRVARWQQDVLSAFDQAAQLEKSGHTTHAEVQVDQAAAAMEDARVRSKPIANDFFDRASAGLDAILNAQPGSQPSAQSSGQGAVTNRLLQHVTQARIVLAELRSLWETAPPDSVLAADEQASAQNAAVPVNVSSAGAGTPGFSRTLPPPEIPAGHVLVNAPREIAAGLVLDPAALGGNFLDASLMPDTAEILLPPETRQFSDNVRVQDLTIAGASQTLDGIHWRNVTFIGTRLRYEDGQLDLENVRFVRCTFGFPSDERGASIANAIVQGKTSLTIQ